MKMNLQGISLTEISLFTVLASDSGGAIERLLSSEIQIQTLTYLSTLRTCIYISSQTLISSAMPVRLLEIYCFLVYSIAVTLSLLVKRIGERITASKKGLPHLRQSFCKFTCLLTPLTSSETLCFSQNLLTNTDAVWCDFHQLIICDEFQGFFQ